MTITRHAAQRLQQRGFTQTAVDLILQFGIEYHRPGGAVEYLFTGKSAIELERDRREYKSMISKLRGRALLFTNGELCTAYFRSKKLKN
jgi:hypothetical protein